MKSKVFSLAMITSLLASMFLMMIPTGTAQYLDPLAAPVIAVRLPNGTQDMNVSAGPPYDIGDRFNVTVWYENVTEMVAYGFTLVWNSTYMNMTGWWPNLAPSGWGAQLIAFWTNDLNSQPGPWMGLIPPRIGAFTDLGQTAFGDQYNITGTFQICTIEFRINTYGPHGHYIWKDPANYGAWPYVTKQPELSQEGAFPTALHLPYCNVQVAPGAVLVDYNVRWSLNPYFNPATAYSGSVANTMLWIQPPTPYPPEATKTHDPPFPFVNDPVTFTITQTKAGFDGATTHDIDMVYIQFGDGNSSSAAPVGGVATFVNYYVSVGTFVVSVQCIASGMPGGLQWHNFSQSIDIYAKALTGIDVYQIRHPIWPGDPAGNSGEGQNIPGRPYDPQSLVVLEAFVFYNGEPVQAKIVSFEVTIPALEQCIAYRTDQANESGHAQIELRIPELCWEYGGPEAIFGKWFVFVSVEMCEVKFNDTMWFDVGYILTTSGMISVDDCDTPEPTENFKKCDSVCFLVTVTNIDWYTIPAKMILVVYDDNEVPIGQTIMDIDVPGGAFCEPNAVEYCICLHIPKYAYVGTERPIGYINLFTDFPSLCGLPYCPEVSDPIVILATE